MYKVGDKVRVFGKGKVKEVVALNHVFGYRLNDNDYYIEEELELVEDYSNYITTKDFIKEVEKLGYEVEEVHGTLHIEGSNFVFLHQVNRFKVESVSDNVLDLIVRLAKTPIEFREEKEKLYTLELPGNICESDKYYNVKEGKYFFGMKDNRLTTYKTQFTQKEIDKLPNQELIKALVKKEVKENNL